ncbi:MAG: 3-hydroxybutyryl-CoA dehydrogenase [Acidaminococcales bacterium]|nr:3-hydroxybutyryl-CoA dehydrogenase [Acidaminococcales bacterium]
MKKILVVGTGQMGGGIIQVLLQGGYRVNAYDAVAAALAALKPKIGKAFDKLKEKGKADDAQINGWLDSLTTCDSLEAAAADIDLVIEAATENVDLKISLFKKLDELCAKNTILASNTSSISITKIAAATKRPEKVTGMHFFNPVPVMKLLEIIPGLHTAEETCGACQALGEKLGKTVVRINIDAPGFVVNRILVPMINEAVLVLQEGITGADAIDKAMAAGANHPMGPLALSDLIGNDTVLAIMQVLYDEFQDPKYRPALLLKRMVAAGKLGRKSGEGFFPY